MISLISIGFTEKAEAKSDIYIEEITTFQEDSLLHEDRFLNTDPLQNQYIEPTSLAAVTLFLLKVGTTIYINIGTWYPYVERFVYNKTVFPLSIKEKIEGSARTYKALFGSGSLYFDSNGNITRILNQQGCWWVGPPTGGRWDCLTSIDPV